MSTSCWLSMIHSMPLPLHFQCCSLLFVFIEIHVKECHPKTHWKWMLTPNVKLCDCVVLLKGHAQCLHTIITNVVVCWMGFGMCVEMNIIDDVIWNQTLKMKNLQIGVCLKCLCKTFGTFFIDVVDCCEQISSHIKHTICDGSSWKVEGKTNIEESRIQLGWGCVGEDNKAVSVLLVTHSVWHHHHSFLLSCPMTFAGRILVLLWAKWPLDFLSLLQNQSFLSGSVRWLLVGLSTQS